MKYTTSHEWVRLEEEDLVTVGVTDYAQRELGEIVYVELPAVDRVLQAGEEVAVLESTKAAADVYAPLSGTVTAVNGDLEANSELVNQSPEDKGWLFKMRLANVEELKHLLDADAYAAQLS